MLQITTTNEGLIPLTLDKYACVLGTLFAFDIGDDFIDALKISNAEAIAIFQMDIADGLERYKEGIKRLFQYIIYEDQSYIGNIIIVTHTPELETATREVIAETARKISSTHKLFPDDKVMLSQSVTAFKGSTGDPITHITAFIRCSQHIDKRDDTTAEKIYHYKAEDTDLSFEFRENIMLGNMSTGVTLGTYSFHCKREWMDSWEYTPEYLENHNPGRTRSRSDD